MSEWDSHPLRRKATQIFFACFLGYCFLGFAYVLEPHVMRMVWFWVTASALTFVTVCSVITYVRPKGPAAFVVSTAMLGLLAVHGAQIVGHLVLRAGAWGSVIAACVLAGWIWLGVREQIRDYRQGLRRAPRSGTQKHKGGISGASDPISIRLSDTKLRALKPDLYGWQSWFVREHWGGQSHGAKEVREMIADHLCCGDTRAAVVVSQNPLTVAAYTDEQDAVLLLQFSDFIADQYRLKRGDRLLTVNTYGLGQQMAPDILPGPASTGRYTNFNPLIAEFLSDDTAVIEARKRAIGDAEWKRAARLALARISRPGYPVRDGRPLRSNRPGAALQPQAV